jgi:hypothetical protein
MKPELNFKTNPSYVGFEILTAVVMKISVFCDMMSYILLKVNQCFGGTCYLHLQGWKEIKQEASIKQTMSRAVGFLLDLLYTPEDVPPKHGLMLNRLHGIRSHNVELFKPSLPLCSNIFSVTYVIIKP